MLAQPIKKVNADETNEADWDHKNVEEEHTTTLTFPIKKKFIFALHNLEDFNAQNSIDINKAKVILVILDVFYCVGLNCNVFLVRLQLWYLFV